MALSDWAELDQTLTDAQVATGVTQGLLGGNPPSDATNDFVYAFNSLTTADGVKGFILGSANNPSFAPNADFKGFSVSAAIQRGVGAGVTGFSPFIFCCSGGAIGPTPTGTADDSTNAVGYLLGLGDEDPSKIVLRKGRISAGVTSSDAGNGVLSSSASLYEPAISPGTWVHLRLDVVVNLNSDNVIRVFENRLDTGNVDQPDWEEITSMKFIDGSTGINSEDKDVEAGFTLPLSGGFAGFAFKTYNVSRRSYFDHVQVVRQL